MAMALLLLRASVKSDKMTLVQYIKLLSGLIAILAIIYLGQACQGQWSPLISENQSSTNNEIPAPQIPSPNPEAPSIFTISSNEFMDMMPLKTDTGSCDNQPNISPKLFFYSFPANTKSAALVMLDLDAGIVHWVVYDILPSLMELPRGASLPSLALEGKIRQGLNTRNQLTYFGPCPPQGTTHRYEFTLYALDQELGTPNLNFTQLNQLMSGKVIGKTKITGLYSR